MSDVAAHDHEAAFTLLELRQGDLRDERTVAPAHARQGAADALGFPDRAPEPAEGAIVLAQLIEERPEVDEVVHVGCVAAKDRFRAVVEPGHDPFWAGGDDEVVDRGVEDARQVVRRRLQLRSALGDRGLQGVGEDG